MQAFVGDLIHGFRRLAAQPGSSLIIVLTLAFGIGANTAIFSLVNGIALRDLPFSRGADIVEIRQQAPAFGVDNVGASALEVQDYREQNKTLEGIVEFHFMHFFIEGASPALVKAGVVSANFFDFLGVAPALGRGFVASDDAHGAAPVIMLSQPFWRSHYGGDPQVVGRTIELNGKAHEVVGVLPPMPQFPALNDVYLPTSGCPTRASDSFIHDRGSRMMSVYGRTRPGVSLEQAASDIGLIAARMKSAHPELYPAESGFTATALSLQEQLTAGIRPSLQLLLAASLLMLLVTCSNVVNLTLAQHSGRQQEFAVRVALGAGRRDIVRKLLSESLLLALAGGIGGLLIAHVGLNLLVAFAAGFTSRASEVALDGTALAFNLATALLIGLVAGLAPLLFRGRVQDGLKDASARATSGRQRHRVRRLMIVGQIAIAFVLVTGAGLMIRSFMALQSIDPGFRSDGVTAVTVPLNWARYDGPDTIRRFVGELERELDDMPGIDQLAFATGYPFASGVGTSLGQSRISLADRADPRADTPGAGHRAHYRTVSRDYFELMGIPLLSGRSFDTSDAPDGAPVAVISTAMADRYWPGEDPLGRSFSMDDGNSWMRVVGVVGNVRDAGLQQPATDTFYMHFPQAPAQSLNLLLRTDADPAATAARVRSAIATIDPGQPVSKVITLSRAVADSLSAPRLLSQVLGLFSTLALVISMVGISGLLAYSVSQRFRELGIRMALGAEPGFIRQLVLRQGLVLVLAGLATGLLGSLLLGRLASGLLHGSSATDPLTYLLVGLLFVVVSLAACWGPAARASRLDPNVSLRSS